MTGIAVESSLGPVTALGVLRSRRSPGWRIVLVKNILAAAMLAGLALSPVLWLSSRSYPLFPLIPGFTIPSPLDAISYALFLFLSTYLIIQKRPRQAVLAFVLLAFVVALADQSRWQPWFFQYLFMLIPFGLYRWMDTTQPQESQEAASEAVLNACRAILSLTYIHSGFQKLNAGFWEDTGPWLARPIVNSLHLSTPPDLTRLIGVVPILEILMGVGLLLPYARLIAVVGVIGMHGVILCSIGPWGRNWNTIVWPWNVAMIVLVPILFIGTGRLSARDILIGCGRPIYATIIVIVFGILPVFSFFGWWDLYLSASLYSGRTPAVTVEFGPSVYRRLPGPVRNQCSPVDWERYRIDLMMWSIAEMNVPEYPEMRMYQHVAKSLADWTDGEAGEGVRLRIKPLPTASPRSKETILDFSGTPRGLQAPRVGR